MDKISTSALAKLNAISSKELFANLSERGLLTRNNDNWTLTQEGKSIGGEYKNSTKFGQYIVWPKNLPLELLASSEDKTTSAQLLTAKTIAVHFDVSSKKINFVLSELGWLTKAIKGWLLTEQGKSLGGVQAEDKKSGIPYVRWPNTIVEKQSLLDSIEQLKGKSSQGRQHEIESAKGVDFREKFEAKHRSTDGHFVRSKAEMLIDNWLYMAEIVHAYERKLPVEENVYSDFYIPTGKVYIEYWGYENEEKYLARKKQKIEIYKKYGFNLIELQDSDVQNLDDVLPRKLLKYGVQAY